MTIKIEQLKKALFILSQNRRGPVPPGPPGSGGPVKTFLYKSIEVRTYARAYGIPIYKGGSTNFEKGELIWLNAVYLIIIPP